MTEILPEGELPTDPKELQRLVQEMSRRQTKELRFSASDEYRTLLGEAYANISAPPQRFEAGQLVRWKPGLSNRNMPDVASVAVVIEHLNEPIFDDKDSSTAYFREPLDLALGIIVGDDRTFLIYWFDSRRFETANG